MSRKEEVMKKFLEGTVHDAKMGMQSWRVIGAASLVGFLAAIVNVAVSH